MEKVKTFFKVFINSLLPHYPYYHTLLHTKLLPSFKYFFYLSFFVYLTYLCIYIIKMDAIQTINKTTTEFSKSLQSYPEKLIITVKNGLLSTNHNMPYFMWMDLNNSKLLLFVVDQNATTSDMEKYRPLALVTRDSVIVRDIEDSATLKVHSLKGVDTVITKSKMLEFDGIIQKIVSVMYFVVPLALVFIFPFFVVLANLAYAVIASFIVYIIARNKYKITYRKTLQLAFHAITLPLLINYTLGIFQLRIGSFPFPFFLLYLLFIAVAVYESHLVYPKPHDASVE